MLLALSSLLGAQSFLTSKTGVCFSNTRGSYSSSQQIISLAQSLGFEQTVHEVLAITFNASLFQEGYRQEAGFVMTDQNGNPLPDSKSIFQNNYTTTLSVNVPVKVYYKIGNVKIYGLAGPAINFKVGSGVYYNGAPEQSDSRTWESPYFSRVTAYLGAGLDFYRSRSRFSMFAEVATNDIKTSNFMAMAGVKYKLSK